MNGPENSSLENFIKGELQSLIDENGFEPVYEKNYPMGLVIRRYKSDRASIYFCWELDNVSVTLSHRDDEGESECWEISTLRHYFTAEPFRFRALALNSLLVSRHFWFDAGHLEYLKENIGKILEFFGSNSLAEVRLKLASAEAETQKAAFDRSLPYAPQGTVRPGWASTRLV